MNDELKIGDTVIWRGGWNTDPAAIAVIDGIETDCQGKYGRPVDSVSWDHVKQGRRVVVSLTNGHWAYGNQLTPKE